MIPRTTSHLTDLREDVENYGFDLDVHESPTHRRIAEDLIDSENLKLEYLGDDYYLFSSLEPQDGKLRYVHLLWIPHTQPKIIGVLSECAG
jgi:hypothetical protein